MSIPQIHWGLEWGRCTPGNPPHNWSQLLCASTRSHNLQQFNTKHKHPFTHDEAFFNCIMIASNALSNSHHYILMWLLGKTDLYSLTQSWEFWIAWDELLSAKTGKDMYGFETRGHALKFEEMRCFWWVYYLIAFFANLVLQKAKWNLKWALKWNEKWQRR